MGSVAPTLGRLEGLEEQGETMLCLAGGGYRAALFHLGALTRLNELGLLARIDTVGAVGGGSILAAVLAARVPWPLQGAFPDWSERVAVPVREVTRRRARRAFQRRSAQGQAAEAAREEQYARLLARSLGEGAASRPRFVFGASGLTLAGLAGRGDGGGIDWALEESASPPGYGEALVAEAIAAVRADLSPLGEGEQAVLENHGYLLADAAARSSSRDRDDDRGGEWPSATPPHPSWMDEERVWEELEADGRGSWRARFGWRG